MEKIAVNLDQEDIKKELISKILAELTPEQAKTEREFKDGELQKMAELIATDRVAYHGIHPKVFYDVLKEGILSWRELIKKYGEKSKVTTSGGGPQTQQEYKWSKDPLEYFQKYYSDKEPISAEEVKNAEREEYYYRNIIGPLARKIEKEGLTGENQKMLTKAKDVFDTFDLISAYPADLLKKFFLQSGKDITRLHMPYCSILFDTPRKVRTYRFHKAEIGISHKILPSRFRVIAFGEYSPTMREYEIGNVVNNRELEQLLQNFQKKGVVILDGYFQPVPDLYTIKITHTTLYPNAEEITFLWDEKDEIEAKRYQQIQNSTTTQERGKKHGEKVDIYKKQVEKIGEIIRQITINESGRKELEKK